ncbi:cupin domain-containing protein [Flavisolibacter tropicus]|uniref:Cupin n=1 Tax=Flavisolibacter tropicus TaxID=1492898 RepID=A0A172TT74_9BACT|nr:cupin domain-containing protein [Flavisolibacter tropicus]ANE50295.1 cupin [Flavisolibacter tropicus]
MKPVSKNNCLQHYTWGDNCDGWNLVAEDSLSVKQERMPAKTAEAKHYHNQAQQFFYILKGIAQFEIEGDHIDVVAGEGIHIKPGQRHRILNNTDEELEFLLCSQPSTINDRINCD